MTNPQPSTPPPFFFQIFLMILILIIDLFRHFAYSLEIKYYLNFLPRPYANIYISFEVDSLSRFCNNLLHSETN